MGFEHLSFTSSLQRAPKLLLTTTVRFAMKSSQYSFSLDPHYVATLCWLVDTRLFQSQVPIQPPYNNPLGWIAGLLKMFRPYATDSDQMCPSVAFAPAMSIYVVNLKCSFFFFHLSCLPFPYFVVRLINTVSIAVGF